jgi:hypothetical protein
MQRSGSVLVAASIVFQVACAQEERLKFDLSSFAMTGGSTPTVEIEGGEARTIQLVVMGTGADPISLSASNLPTFASLSGMLLSLSPSRADAGVYTITLTATAGTQSQNADLQVVVHRSNRPPLFGGGAPMLADDNGLRDSLNCTNESWCTAYGRVKLYYGACDPDGDSVTLDLEIVPRGTQFSGKPTVSVSAPVGRPQNPTVLFNTANCVMMELPLPELVPEVSYDLAVRVTDAFGAIAAERDSPLYQDGWLRVQGFDQGPCFSRQCACIKSGTKPNPCWYAADCCSGICQNRQCQ